MFTGGFEKVAISLTTAQSAFAKRLAKAYRDPGVVKEVMGRLPELTSKEQKNLSGHSWRNLISGERYRKGLLNAMGLYKARGKNSKLKDEVWAASKKRYLTTTPYASPAELTHPELVNSAKLVGKKGKALLKSEREYLDGLSRRHTDTEWERYRR